MLSSRFSVNTYKHTTTYCRLCNIYNLHWLILYARVRFVFHYFMCLSQNHNITNLNKTCIMSYIGAYKYTKESGEKEVNVTSKASSSAVTIAHFNPTKEDGPLVVVIPGNPGVVDYYVPYIEAINTTLGYETLCISHIGHDSSSMDPDTLSSLSIANRLHKAEHVFGLQEQIDSKYQIVSHFAQFPEGNPNKQKYDKPKVVILLGHSVGAYMAQRVAVALREDGIKIHVVGLLFPTIIDISKSDKGKQLTLVLSWLPRLADVVAWLSVIFMVIPNWFLTILIGVIVRPFPSNRVIAIKSTKKLVTCPVAIRQALGLASDEMRLINHDEKFNSQFFGQFKSWCYFAKYDHWVSDSTRELIKQKYFKGMEERVVVGDKFSHSFVINHGVEFAKVTSDILKRI